MCVCVYACVCVCMCVCEGVCVRLCAQKIICVHRHREQISDYQWGEGRYLGEFKIGFCCSVTQSCQTVCNPLD